MPVVQIIDEPVPITRPFINARAMLEVVQFCVASLPFLQWNALASKTELDGRGYELKALQLERLAELSCEIEADHRAEQRPNFENHEHTAGYSDARGSRSFRGTLADGHGSPASNQPQLTPRCTPVTTD